MAKDWNPMLKKKEDANPVQEGLVTSAVFPELPDCLSNLDIKINDLNKPRDSLGSISFADFEVEGPPRPALEIGLKLSF